MTITLLSGNIFIFALLMTASTAFSSATAPFKLTYNLKPKKISPSIYWLEGINDYPSEANGGNMVNTGFIIGDKSVMVIDTGWSKIYAEEKLAAIAKITKKPISHIVITHGHPDHAMAAHHYIKKTGAKYVGNKNVVAFFEEKREFSWRLAKRFLPSWLKGEKIDLTNPDILVPERMSVDLGNKVVELISIGGGHTDADLLVWVPSEKTLFTGDIIFNKVIPATRDAHIPTWLKKIDIVSSMGAMKIIPGHGPAGGPKTINFIRRYLSTLWTVMKKFVDGDVDMVIALETAGMDEYKDIPRFKGSHGKNMIKAFQQAEWELFGP